MIKAVVIDPTGETATFDDGYQVTMPAGWQYNGAELLDQIRHMGVKGEAVLIIPDAWTSVRAGDALSNSGWHWREAPHGEPTRNGWGAWTTFSRPGCAIHVGIRPLIDDSRTPLFGPGDLPHVVSRRLADFHRLTGVSFRKTPGVAGAAMLRDLYTEYGPLRQPLWKFGVDNPEVRGIGDLIWHRARNEQEKAHLYVHGFDVHGAYLAAAGVADLAWSDLHPWLTGEPIRFDPARAGFWRVLDTSTVHRFDDDPYAIPLYGASRVLEDGTVWMSTPAVRTLVEFGARPAIVEATVADCVLDNGKPGTRRLMRPWSEAIRDARMKARGTVGVAGDETVQQATLKRVPNEAIGMLNPTERGRGRIDRWDWAWTIRDLSRGNFTRKIVRVHERTNRWPVRAKTDAVYYTSEHADIGEAALELGIDLAQEWKPGAWHPLGTTPAAEWADPREYPTTMDADDIAADADDD